MRDVIEQLFPLLLRDGFEITSPSEPAYNCVAWAAGDTRRWWWPAERAFSYWPDGVLREESITSFIEAFATLGYEVADAGDLEPEFEKVTIFASNDGVPTHVARQLPDGTWTSKLGSMEDIAHADVNSVSGSAYGSVMMFLRRRRKAMSSG